MGPKKTVFILDDQAYIGRLLVLMLEQDPEIDPISFTETEQFLGALKAGPPDLVILDVMLPGRSGASLANELRLKHPDLPILLISGNVEEPGERFEFLEKPFDQPVLMEKVRRLLGIGAG